MFMAIEKIQSCNCSNILNDLNMYKRLVENLQNDIKNLKSEAENLKLKPLNEKEETKIIEI